MNVADLVEQHEGRKYKPYTDPVGKVTIGVGCNLTDVGLYDNEIDFIKANRIAIARDMCVKLFGVVVMGSAVPDPAGADARAAALIDMCFELGSPKLGNFHNLIAAVKAADWERAASEALNSDWAREVPSRAHMDAEMLRTGQWPA